MSLIEVPETLTEHRQLQRSAFHDIPFVPAPGEAIAFGGAIDAPGVGSKFEANPDEVEAGGPFDPDLLKAGRLDVSIRAPTGKVMASGSGLQQVRFEIPDDLAFKEWRARVRNLDLREIRAALSVTFVKARHLALTTPLALRVLNHGLRTALEVLGITVHIDGKRSSVGFSDDLSKLTGIPLNPLTFDSKVAHDINLQTIGITAGQSSSGLPRLRIFIEFETEGVEIGLSFVDLADVTAASIVVELDMQTHGRAGNRTLVPTFQVTANVGTRLTPAGVVAAGLLFFGGLATGGPKDIDELIELLRSNVEKRLNSADVRQAFGRYVPAALVQLARRGHVFHELGVTGTDFVLTHYDPVPLAANSADAKSPEEIPVPGLPQLPDLPIPDLDPRSLANLNKIAHIVVVMQENRSFDNVLGFLAQAPFERDDVDGVKASMGNTFEANSVKVNPLSDRLFPLSPAHDRIEVASQIRDGRMTGFLESWIRRYGELDLPLSSAERKTPLSFHTADQVPTYRFLADNYLICTRWFAAFPGPTQPNRFCTLSGRTPVLDNFEFDDPSLGYLELKTIFEFLEPDDWVYYERDIGFIRFYDRFRLDNRNVIPFSDPTEGFVARASRGDLPRVTFIDPNFRDIPPMKLADDDLPPADIRNGQNSIACIYDTLVDSPGWTRTLLVVTYDEHGGFFDHVAPPGTRLSESPGRQVPVHLQGPSHLGVRVPALIVSPWVSRGAVSSRIFDHTSIGRTILLKMFGASAPAVTPRMVRAAHLGEVLTRATVRGDRPRIPVDDCRDHGRPLPPAIDPDLSSTGRPDDLRETMQRFGRPPAPR